MSDLLKLLETLSNAFGPSGNEEDVREILKKELKGCADEIHVDKLGNIFFHHNDLQGVEYGSLIKGQEVEFDVEQGQDGRNKAVRVRLPQEYKDAR